MQRPRMQEEFGEFKIKESRIAEVWGAELALSKGHMSQSSPFTVQSLPRPWAGESVSGDQAACTLHCPLCFMGAL